MTRIRHQFMAPEIAGKDLLAGRRRLLSTHPVKSGAAPCLLRAFDDKCRCVGVELVGVRPDPAVLGLLEDKGEGVVEFLLRAKPDIFAGAHLDVGLEHIGVGGAHPRIHAIRTHDEIVIGVGSDIFSLRLEFELDPERKGTFLKDIQQPLAADAGKSVTT